MKISKILLVEDNYITSQEIKERLNSIGYSNVVCVLTGEEAIEKTIECPDLILMDINLGDGMDGIETAEIIKRFCDVPLIYLTAYTDEKTIQRAKITEPFGYVIKPIQEKELQIAIEIGFYKYAIAKKLNNANKQLIKLNATKDKFFSIIAHDLKGPFGNVMNFSELLVDYIDKYDKEKIKKLAGHINNSSKHVYDLLCNLLEWARIQTDTIKHVPYELNIAEIIDEAKMVLESTALEKNISIYTNIDDNYKIYADRNMVTTVIRNLISNAIKFTHIGGKISIYADIKLNSDNKPNIEISVIDTGVGIAENNIEKLFKIDGGYTTQGTENERGTGLGLLLCKEFVEKNNGEIWVESEFGKGSRFIISLPQYNTEL